MNWEGSNQYFSPDFVATEIEERKPRIGYSTSKLLTSEQVVEQPVPGAKQSIDIFQRASGSSCALRELEIVDESGEGRSQGRRSAM